VYAYAHIKIVSKFSNSQNLRKSTTCVEITNNIGNMSVVVKKYQMQY